ncbi:TIGR03986 family type III CRISPR-associated RAMP protein [Arachnia propionica]|jgi:CRISPR-associated protein|uniref:TIGR03986 family type III CRISPR-associated RAMP protein n=1 Tax=Arachnia propionica TaxID=1750 RepID=UPI000F819AC7|nr:TIGR03986 family CRISPR-associated RAMP protein [Arachnia propionica]
MPGRTEDFKPFHSAVNRIPVPRRSAHNLARHNVLPPDLFLDGPAPSHDHLAPDRWSGSVDLEITVHTPLVFGQQSEENGRNYVDLPTDGHDSLVMPSTMVKGMISRAYETLTCSRFRVFGDVENQGGFRRTADDRSVPLTYRGDAASALGLVPIRITGEDEDGLICTLYYGDTKVTEDYREHNLVYPKMRAAALQGTSHGPAKLVVSQDRLDRLAPHGKKIICDMTLCLHGRGGKRARYAYWLVTHIHDENTGQPIEIFRIPESITTTKHLDGVTGYVCRTAAPNQSPGDLFPKKHDERVFFDISPHGPTQVRISSRVREAYRAVVESYVAQRSKDPKNKKQPPNRATDAVHREQREAVKTTGVSHIAVPTATADVCAAASLTVGTVAFAVVDNSNDYPVVVEIIPTMIGRHAYQRSPLELAKAQEVAPLTNADDASPADRLFGYVIRDKAGKGGNVALRGRISIGPVDGTQATIVSNTQQLLTPLLAPKPGSARRYLTDHEGRTPRRHDGNSDGALPRSDLFRDGQLLGAAAYPVHRRILDQKGFPAAATADPIMDGRPQKNLETRITARTWLATGSVLTTTLTFTNLSSDELAALLWVLTPENLVPASEQDDQRSKIGYLRMGLGKPFGLGALEVRAVEGSLQAQQDGSLAQDYASLRGCMGAGSATTDPSEAVFDTKMPSVITELPWVQAMQRAAYGYADDTKVRHMSLNENKENNQTNGTTGEPRPGKGVAPRDLFGSDSGEPIVVPGKPKGPTRNPRGGNRPRRRQR